MQKLWLKIKDFFKKYTFMKWLAPLLALVIALSAIFIPMLFEKDEQAGQATKLSFKSAAEYAYLKTLDGTRVTINGYIATSSPVDGSFIFLMNMPYQSCPFCVPNTSQLSNTMEVYPKKGESFDYTPQAIKVEGTLMVAENEDEPFTDEFGYEFNYKIVDAEYIVLKSEDLSADLALWQQIAESNVINEVDQMYNFVNFTCAWNTYYSKYIIDDTTGEIYASDRYHYLYAADAQYFLFTDGAQWNFGTKEGYFEGIINKITAIDPTAFKALTDNIKKAQVLAQKAMAELRNGNYDYEEKYVEDFGVVDKVYSLHKEAELQAEMRALYQEFSNWLGGWEM